MRKAIGSRWECACCGRVARIIGRTKAEYFYEFEREHGTRWISERDAIIRFRPVGDDMETVKRKMEKMTK